MLSRTPYDNFHFVFTTQCMYSFEFLLCVLSDERRNIDITIKGTFGSLLLPPTRLMLTHGRPYNWVVPMNTATTKLVATIKEQLDLSQISCHIISDHQSIEPIVRSIQQYASNIYLFHLIFVSLLCSNFYQRKQQDLEGINKALQFAGIADNDVFALEHVKADECDWIVLDSPSIEIVNIVKEHLYDSAPKKNCTVILTLHM